MVNLVLIQSIAVMFFIPLLTCTTPCKTWQKNRPQQKTWIFQCHLLPSPKKICLFMEYSLCFLPAHRCTAFGDETVELCELAITSMPEGVLVRTVYRGMADWLGNSASHSAHPQTFTTSPFQHQCPFVTAVPAQHKAPFISVCQVRVVFTVPTQPSSPLAFTCYREFDNSHFSSRD